MPMAIFNSYVCLFTRGYIIPILYPIDIYHLVFQYYTPLIFTKETLSGSWKDIPTLFLAGGSIINKCECCRGQAWRIFADEDGIYPLVNKHNYGKSAF